MTSPGGEWTRGRQTLAIPYRCIYDTGVSLWGRNLMCYRELPRRTYASPLTKRGNGCRWAAEPNDCISSF